MTLTTVAAVQDGAWPQVSLVVTEDPATTDRLKVWRYHENGSRWPVLTVENIPKVIGGGWVGLDVHAPFNQYVTYRAEVRGVLGDASNEVRLLSKKTWLIHPSDPTKSVALDRLRSSSDFVNPMDFTLGKVPGRGLPLSESDTLRGSEQGTLTITQVNRTTRLKLHRLLADGWVLLLNSPYAEDDYGWKWIQPESQTRRNRAGYATFTDRDFIIPYTEVEAPDVDLRSLWTVGDITALGQTCGQLAVTYDTVADMALDRRTP